MQQKIRVLIADDHPLFRKGLRQAIEEAGDLQIVGEASDGQKALEMISELDPEVAVLDIDMPARSGLEVAQAVSRSGRATATVFLTIFREADFFNRAMDLGARGYLLKESAVLDVVTCVRTVNGGDYYITPQLSSILLERRARRGMLLGQYPGLEELTRMERQVLAMVAETKTSREIAETLHISSRTVESHRSNIAAKLHLRGAHTLLRFALEHRSSLLG